jgi:hypothetical protein
MQQKGTLKGIAEQLNEALKDPKPGSEKEFETLVNDLEKQMGAVEQRIITAQAAAKVAWDNYLKADAQNRAAEARKKREANQWQQYLRETGRGGGGRRTRRKAH